MFRKWILPVFLLLFSLLSLTILRSVAPSLLNRQLAFFVIGGGVFWLTSRVVFSQLVKMSPFLYGGLVFFLVLTQLIGQVTRGTRSWIPVGPFHIQPSQLAVVIAGLFLSQMVAEKSIRDWQSYAQFAFFTGLPAVLIFLEPDLGTAIIYVVSMASIFFLSKTKDFFLGFSIGTLVIGVIVAWIFVLKPYQKERVTSFLNLEGTYSDAQYNAVQSVIAVGSGQIYGRGLGQGVQSHLRFLPERQTDFVFASFAEETGLLGSVLLISLFALLTSFVIFIGVTAHSPTEQYFCFATATMLVTQVGVNIGMNMGLFPITGITLPMISYGGSSILSFCFHYACIQSIVNSYKKRVTLHIS